MATRTGTLSAKTYWPGPGDMLEDEELGICWEAARTNKLTDEVSGETVRYALLLGRHADFDTPIVKTIHDRDESLWLEGITTIHRKRAGGYVEYKYSEAHESWRS